MKFDVLIVGAGGAGLYSALEAAKNAKDLKVGVLTKVYPTRSHTGAAQGGINAALANIDPRKPKFLLIYPKQARTDQ